MIRLLPELSGPYFDFLVLPNGYCWERRGYLKKECFHHPEALRVQDDIISVFLRAFNQSQPRFNYYGPTEYQGHELNTLVELLVLHVTAIRSCRTRKQFLAKLNNQFTSACDEDLRNWLVQWRSLRNELEIYVQRILNLALRAQREGKALLVMGV